VKIEKIRRIFIQNFSGEKCEIDDSFIRSVEKVERLAESGIIVSILFTFVILIVLYVYVKCSKNNLQESRRHRFTRQLSDHPIIQGIQNTLNCTTSSMSNSKKKTEKNIKTTEEEQSFKV
jgi:hypothetical protein